MRILDWIFAVILCALGVLHCVLTPFITRGFTLSALWFFSAGLALMYGGMLNLLRLRGPASPLLRLFALIANASMLGVALAFAFKVRLAHDPQGIVLIVVLAGEFLFSLRKRR